MCVFFFFSFFFFFFFFCILSILTGIRRSKICIIKDFIKNKYDLHFSAHMENCLSCENQKSIPKCFNGDFFFLFFLKNVTLQILNFILVSEIIKSFSIWCNVNFVSVLSALNNTKKKQRKFDITSNGEMFYLLLLISNPENV